jgi:hypothetical protein
VSRDPRTDPLHADPVAWFHRLERAVREQDYLIAGEAKRQLARLGWDVRQTAPRPRHEAPGREADR